MLRLDNFESGEARLSPPGSRRDSREEEMLEQYDRPPSPMRRVTSHKPHREKSARERQAREKQKSTPAIATLVEEAPSELQEAFDLIDEDSDGLISVNDLGRFMKLVGMSATNSDIAEMMLEFDSNGDGYLSFQDFEKVLQTDLFQGDVQGDTVREAFRQFDSEGSGVMTLAEVQVLLQQFGTERLEDGEFAEVLRENILVENDNFNYENLIECVMQSQAASRSSRGKAGRS